MIIKKLFLLTSITLLTTATVLPDNSQPEPQESTAQYIKANFTNILLYITMRLNSTFNSSINYIKSFFWPKLYPTNTTEDTLLSNMSSEEITTVQTVTEPLHNMIQERDPKEALALVTQDLNRLNQIQQASSGKPTESKSNIAQLIKKTAPPKGKTKTEAVEEINSPAIEKEKAEAMQKQLSQLVQHVKELDMAIAQLPATEWPKWQEQQTKLLTPATAMLKNAIQQSIQQSWKEHGAAILKIAIQATNTGITGALGVFAGQYAKMATGNLEKLDTDALVVTFLTYASATLISKTNALLISNKPLESIVSTTETNILFQAVLAPSIQHKTYQFRMPLFRGVIDSLIINEAYEVMNKMLEQNGEIYEAMKNINIKQVLLGKKTPPTSNMFVSLALPKVKTVINNQKLALALTEVGWIFFQSATLGGLFWAAGLGYANSTFAESVGNAVLTGMAQGIVANVAALTNNTTPGALVSISTVPLSQQMVASTGVNISTTPQAIVTAVIQVIGTEATNFIIDQTEKSGGFLSSLQKGKEALGSAISSRWSSVWANITDVWDNMQEIEPVPL